MHQAVRTLVACTAFVAAPALAGPEVGDYRGLPQGLAAAATAYDIAQFKKDRAGLDRWLASDYVLAGTGGQNFNKTQAITDALAPGRKTTYVAVNVQTRRVWPNGAVLGGMVDARGTDHGKPFGIRARFVDVWAKRQGRWQVVFTQINTAT
jgi:hypothetical protein